MNEREGDPRHQREFLRICGLAAVEALFARNSARVERLFFEARMQPLVLRYCAILARAKKPYRAADAAELARIAGTPRHGGVVAVVRPRSLPVLDLASLRFWASSGKPLLILDGIGNPHNLGAIARTAAFFEVERLLLADRPEQALPSDASYRVAEGGLEHLLIYRSRLGEALPALKSFYRLIGTALDRGAMPTRQPSSRPWALILGNEEIGLAPETLALCDEIIRLKGSGRVQSLNVAAAAAVLLFALSRG